MCEHFHQVNRFANKNNLLANYPHTDNHGLHSQMAQRCPVCGCPVEANFVETGVSVRQCVDCDFEKEVEAA